VQSNQYLSFKIDSFKMSYLIAVSGKGGVGKTTVAGLIVASLIRRQCCPVLAVDADPNTCLDAVLGVKAEKTIGLVRENAKQEAAKGMSTGVSKQQLLEMKIAESLVEADNFDLIAMGRSEGPGCYCYANNVLKSAIGQISAEYPYVVLDNEAGLENLSRRIVQNVDVLVMVADPSRRGLETLSRLHCLTKEMEIKYGKLAIVVNRLRNGQLPDYAVEIKKETGADFIIGIGENDELADYAENGRNLLELPAENAVARQIYEFIGELDMPSVKKN
jgi:CO dehydrogenase maturation factor